MAVNSIIWNYINKKSIAIEAIKDYRNMQKIIEITPDKLKEEEERLTSVSGGVMNDMPHAPRNSQSFDNKLINCINSIDVLKEKYRHALDFFYWFTPAWKSLERQEQYILDEFYAKGGNSGASRRLSFELNYSEPQIYRKKEYALNRFTVLLLG
jgi:hypothetical protein